MLVEDPDFSGDKKEKIPYPIQHPETRIRYLFIRDEGAIHGISKSIAPFSDLGLRYPEIEKASFLMSRMRC